MKNLFISYLYKLRHDLAFKITLIIGGGLALFLTLIYFLLSMLIKVNMLDGPSMLISSLSPGSNFGLAVPINLITFTVLEFNHGSIRNKIISGHSKANVYTSLFLNGLVFTFALMIVYTLLCFGLGSLFGVVTKNILEGMKNDEIVRTGYSEIMPESMSVYGGMYIFKTIVLAVFCYISIVSFTIFFSTLFRNIGPSIPVVILVLVFASSLIPIVLIIGDRNEGLIWAFRIIDPLFCLGAGESEVVGQTIVMSPDGMPIIQDITEPTITNETFISGICSNVFYAAAFYLGGLFIFKKRDVK